MTICGAKVHVPEPALKSPDRSALAVPMAAVSEMRGKEGRPGGADIGVGRLEQVLRRQDVGPAQEHLRGEAGGDLPGRADAAQVRRQESPAAAGDPARRFRAFSSWAASCV